MNPATTVTNQVPANTRAFAQLAGRTPAEIRQALMGLDAAALEVVKQEAANAVRYGWLTRDKAQLFSTFLGPLR